MKNRSTDLAHRNKKKPNKNRTNKKNNFKSSHFTKSPCADLPPIGALLAAFHADARVAAHSTPSTSPKTALDSALDTALDTAPLAAMPTAEAKAATSAPVAVPAAAPVAEIDTWLRKQKMNHPMDSTKNFSKEILIKRFLTKGWIMKFSRIALALTTVGSFAACKPTNTRSVTPGQLESPANPTQNVPTVGAPSGAPGGAPSSGANPGAPGLRGTGDWGGGNGQSNKVFESYIIDVEKLPEFKNHLLAISQHLDQVAEEPGNQSQENPSSQEAKDSTRSSESNAKNSTFLLQIARMKTWYLAPISLQEIEKEKLGVAFSKDPIQQLAIQTDHEVWIDAEVYKRMSERDRAQLILHEIVMILYQIRFLSLEELCNTLGSCKGMENSLISDPRVSESFRPEPKRALTPADYSMIRGATGAIFTQAFKLKTHDEFLLFMQRYQMDKRFWGPRKLDSAFREWTFSHEDLVHSLTTGVKPNYCDYDSQLQASKRCHVQFEKVENSSFNLLNGHVLRMNIIAGKQVMESREFGFFGQQDRIFSGLRCPSGIGHCGVTFALQQLPQDSLQEAQLGTEALLAVIFLRPKTVKFYENGVATEKIVPELDTVQLINLYAVKNTPASSLPGLGQVEFAVDLDNLNRLVVSASPQLDPLGWAAWQQTFQRNIPFYAFYKSSAEKAAVK